MTMEHRKTVSGIELFQRITGIHAGYERTDPATLNARAESAGYDAAVNGSNTTNCHFSHFGTPERTAAWERGNERGKREQKPQS
jgi:hypothetical protein